PPPPPPTHTHTLPSLHLVEQMDEKRYREICAMDDDQEEMLEPLGLGM
ncbi:unnamed protein product, partial [Choristocarpus tenellus]